MFIGSFLGIIFRKCDPQRNFFHLLFPEYIYFPLSQILGKIFCIKTKNSTKISFDQNCHFLPEAINNSPRFYHFFNKITSVYFKSPNLSGRFHDSVYISRSNCETCIYFTYLTYKSFEVKSLKSKYDQSLNLLCTELQKVSRQQ